MDCAYKTVVRSPTILVAGMIANLLVLPLSLEGASPSSTLPPSSLQTHPLNPALTESEIHTSCDLCRKLERRPGSDLRGTRPRRRGMSRPRRKPNEVHRSIDQSMKSTLPTRKLEPARDGDRSDTETPRIGSPPEVSDQP